MMDDEPDADRRITLAALRTNLILRSYAGTDAAACASIFERAWHAGHPYAPRRIGLDEFRRETAKRSIIVAQTDHGRVLGFAAVYMPDAFVHHLYVEPAHAGQGIGRVLLGAALALAGGRATLKCQARNMGALQFYRREGWTEGERGETDGEPWIRMLSPIPTLMRAALATSAKQGSPPRQQRYASARSVDGS